MLTSLRTICVVAAGLLLTACATGPKYDEMKSSIPPLASNQGRIYFYRPTAFGGQAVQPSIKLNGEKVGSSKPGGFFYVDRPAGDYEVTCSTEVERKADFKLTAGQEKYIKTTVGLGLFVGHVVPEVVDADYGQTQLVGLHYSPDKSKD